MLSTASGFWSIGPPGSESLTRNATYSRPARTYGSTQRIRKKTWRTAWRNLTRAAGLRGLRFHDLRHQCITELLEGGAPEAAVLSIAGHVSRKMMEHYSHIHMEAKRKALEGLTPVVAVESEVIAAGPQGTLNASVFNSVLNSIAESEFSLTKLLMSDLRHS